MREDSQMSVGGVGQHIIGKGRSPNSPPLPPSKSIARSSRNKNQGAQATQRPGGSVGDGPRQPYPMNGEVLQKACCAGL